MSQPDRWALGISIALLIGITLMCTQLTSTIIRAFVIP